MLFPMYITEYEGVTFGKSAGLTVMCAGDGEVAVCGELALSVTL
jgi:hypothetical protein